MAHSHTNLLYHIVFATKDRCPLIDTIFAERLRAYLGGGIRAEGGSATVVNGTPNHVHILAQLRQDKTLSDVLRNIKAHSSKWIHKTYPAHERFAWQSGYGAFTVSRSQVERVRSYIEDRETDHRRTTFEEEFESLLRVHQVDFDPKYLWT